jgi:hypothetical protein
MTIRTTATAAAFRLDREAIRFDQIHYRTSRNGARRELCTILQLHVQTRAPPSPVELAGTGHLKLLLHLSPREHDGNI